MNKKLVTLAVAAALAAPAIASADAILYGKLNVGLSYMDQDMGGQDGFKGWGMSDNAVIKSGWTNQNWFVTNPFITTPQGPANRLGVKGSEDLGNGLKAIYQVELGFSLTDSNNSAANLNGSETITMRNTFVGLAGNFGTALMGRHDTPLKISTGPLDLFADTMADYNNTVGFQDLRADNVVAYISPSFSGFQFAGAIHAGGGSSAVNLGWNYNTGAMSNTPKYNNEANSLAEAYSFAGIYKNGPWYASLAYEGLNSELACVNVTVGPQNISGCGDTVNAETWGKWRVGLGILDWNGFSLTGIYEGWDNGMFTDGAKADLWNVQAGYTFGQMMVKAAYGSNTQKDIYALAGGGRVDNILYIAETPEDFNFKSWSFGLDYNMSKRTKAFALYTANDSDDLNIYATDGISLYGGETGIKWQGFQLGMMHSF